MASFMYASTPESADAVRLCRVLLGPCTDQLRDILHHFVTPTNFRYVIIQNRDNLLSLTASQRDLILPSSGHYEGDYSDMDITLLYLLLRNICKTENTVCRHIPNAFDTSLLASIDRILKARKEVCHLSNIGLTQREFNDLWSIIKLAVHAIDTFLNNGYKYEKAVDKLKTETIDPEQENSIDQLRNQFIEDEATKESVSKVKDTNADVHQLQHTYNEHGQKAHRTELPKQPQQSSETQDNGDSLQCTHKLTEATRKEDFLGTASTSKTTAVGNQRNSLQRLRQLREKSSRESNLRIASISNMATVGDQRNSMQRLRELREKSNRESARRIASLSNTTFARVSSSGMSTSSSKITQKKRVAVKECCYETS